MWMENWLKGAAPRAEGLDHLTKERLREPGLLLEKRWLRRI